MSILVDTSIVLDVLLQRAAFIDSAKLVFKRVELGAVRALLCATTVTTLDYYLGHEFDRDTSRSALRQLLRLFDVAAVGRTVVDTALASGMADFEDAVLAHAAQASGATAIVTRNLRDFAASPVRAYTPEQWLALSPA
ncbi:PIN domain-containing protein [Xylophilus sp. ASV27]|uniref:PIN domain-containing protein n=1 Tax=Xylophilus sp. ASV27 TaxID=2795129 RepID=UPI0018ED2E53|nr:PIN domain-containing protein [Xylophilus sp. ASV27]